MSSNDIRRSFGVNLAKIVSRVIKPVMRKHGFYDVDIINDWSYIVGPEWAKFSIPQKLSFSPHSRKSGTLHVRVSPGANVLLKHIEPEIIDRVNTYFGYEAVKQLKIIHSDVAIDNKPSAPVQEEPNIPLPDIQGIDNEALKLSLQQYQVALKMKKTLKKEV